MELDQIGGKVIKKIQHEQHLSLKKVSKFISMLIPYQETGKIPKIYKNDETLPKKWKRYHKLKIIPVDFRQFSDARRGKTNHLAESFRKQTF